jgi:hypothetical protein
MSLIINPALNTNHMSLILNPALNTTAVCTVYDAYDDVSDGNCDGRDDVRDVFAEKGRGVYSCVYSLDVSCLFA